MSGHSPIDSLRHLAPVSDTQAAETFGAAGREELLDDVTRLPVGRGARRRPARRRRLVLAVAVLIAAATATTAWAVLRGSAAHETTSVQCLIGSSDAIIPSTSGNPAHDCAVDYRREFGTAAPQLAAYDNGRGGVTVIPRSAKPQGRLDPARLRAGRRPDPASGLAGRLHQRPQFELPGQCSGDEPHRGEARPVRLRGLDGRRTQPQFLGNDSPDPDRDDAGRRSEAGAERVHVRHADVCWRRPRRPDDGVGHPGFKPCCDRAEDRVREARRQAAAGNEELRIPTGLRVVGARDREQPGTLRVCPGLRPQYRHGQLDALRLDLRNGRRDDLPHGPRAARLSCRSRSALACKVTLTW